jgi:hypothetical protein
MTSAAGARAESALRDRHRRSWPRNLYCYDADEVRRATGRKLILEAPAGRLVIAAEYKAADDGPLDLGALQFELVADAVTEKLPALAIQFTHPMLDPPQPWAFRLWPLDRLAAAVSPVILTERRYVQLLYVLQRGAASAGGGYGNEGPLPWVTPWQELDRLQDEWPDPRIWPPVTPAKLDRPSRLVPVTFIETARQFVHQLGRFDGLAIADLAPVVPLLNRPTIGALRAAQDGSGRTASAPVKLRWNVEDADRYDRLCWWLNQHYRQMWAGETASDDNRDMWRAFDREGLRRWSARAM